VFPELLDEGVARTVGGNRPFFLDDPASAWLVLTGKVEVFCVERANPTGVAITTSPLTAVMRSSASTCRWRSSGSSRPAIWPSSPQATGCLRT
jgi:hypothetical protein